MCTCMQRDWKKFIHVHDGIGVSGQNSANKNVVVRIYQLASLEFHRIVKKKAFYIHYCRLHCVTLVMVALQGKKISSVIFWIGFDVIQRARGGSSSLEHIWNVVGSHKGASGQHISKPTSTKTPQMKNWLSEFVSWFLWSCTDSEEERHFCKPWVAQASG